MQTITGGGTFTSGNIKALNANFSQLFAGFTPGNIIYCYPGASALGTQDGSVDHPYTDLPTAYSKTRSGKNDVVLLVGNGAAGGSARLTAGLTWSNDATHLIGVCSPTLISQRARIAPTSSVAAFTPFFTVSGNGCLFANISWFMGFTTGTTNQIGMVLSGSRNVFQNCQIAGLAEAASAADAGSRTLKIGGSGAGENLFLNCTIGVDTVTRSAANATIEFIGDAVRNVFRGCIFPFMTSAATPLGFIGSNAACIDRFNSFEDCSFINAVQSTSTTMSGLGTLAASAGGLLLFKNPTLVGITEFGTDATTRGQCYVDGGAPTAGTTGIAVNPT
jgi:hypothetical protein